MKSKFISAALLCMLIAAPAANAQSWTIGTGVTIKRIYQYEGGLAVNYAMVEFSDGLICRVMNTERELLALTMSIYLAGKTVDVHCYPTANDPGGTGMVSRKMHRLTAK